MNVVDPKMCLSHVWMPDASVDMPREFSDAQNKQSRLSDHSRCPACGAPSLPGCPCPGCKLTPPYEIGF